ncbi:MAG: ABC transporter permease, partial [Bacteroidales bacterium]
ELSFDNFHENADRLYRIEQIMNEGDRIERMAGCPTPLWQALKNDFPEIEFSMRFVPGEVQLTSVDGNVFNANACYVEEQFLQAFTFSMIKGDPTEALVEPMSAVLSQSTAERLFGNEDPIGKSYNIDGSLIKITGIMEDMPKNSHLRYDLVISVKTIEKLGGEEIFTRWGDNWVRLYVLLIPGHDISDFRSKIQYKLKEYFYEETLNELDARPVRDIHLYANLRNDYAVRGNIRNVYILTAIAFFILLMAGVNFTNLSVAHSSVRSKEVALRKINGGSRGLLLTQFLGESILTAFISLFLGFVIFESILPLFNRITAQELDFLYLQNFHLFLLIIALGILLGLLSGIYPAILISRFSPISIFRTQTTSGSRNPLLRKLLISIQFFISAALIIGTIGAARQTYYMKNKDLGYNPQNVIRIPLGDTSMSRINTFREEILRNPSVLDATVHDYQVCLSTNWTRVAWEGAQEGEFIRINVNYTDHHYLNTYEMRLVEGEGFTKARLGSDNEGDQVILNRAAVERIGYTDPIGKKILYYGDYKQSGGGLQPTIVGVVEDYHFLSVRNTITPIMLRLYNQTMVGWGLSVRMDPKDIPGTVISIHEKFNEFYPDQAFDYLFIDEYHAQMYTVEDQMARIVFTLAVIAILIACLGVYGLVAFTTSKRTKEIGIRKVMGARFTSITRLFAREFMILLLAANIIAWPVVYYLVKNWLQSFPYKVGFSIYPYLIALILTIIFTLLSMIYHTLKSSRLNTAASLRYE